jgi:hypothetical protein
LTPYDPAAHEIRPGANTIDGNAVLRTIGGEVRTCAGFPVKLMPDTPYVRERMAHVFGMSDHGFTKSRSTFVPPSPHYESQAGRTETCDSQGNFHFSGLADGTYYVVSRVTWGVPLQFYTAPQGGVLMMRVSVHGGETKRIILTRKTLGA